MKSNGALSDIRILDLTQMLPSTAVVFFVVCNVLWRHELV